MASLHYCIIADQQQRTRRKMTFKIQNTQSCITEVTISWRPISACQLAAAATACLLPFTQKFSPVMQHLCISSSQAGAAGDWTGVYISQKATAPIMHIPASCIPAACFYGRCRCYSYSMMLDCLIMNSCSNLHPCTHHLKLCMVQAFPTTATCGELH